jgi:hypothetical protein
MCPYGKSEGSSPMSFPSLSDTMPKALSPLIDPIPAFRMKSARGCPNSRELVVPLVNRAG